MRIPSSISVMRRIPRRRPLIARLISDTRSSNLPCSADYEAAAIAAAPVSEAPPTIDPAEPVRGTQRSANFRTPCFAPLDCESPRC